MIVQFDVDGVLADFDLGYRLMYRERYGIMKEKAQRWDESTDEATWSDIKASPDFWSKLHPLASRADFRDINSLSHMGVSIYFVTARVGREPKRQTEEWLHVHGIDRPTVVVANRKAAFAEAAGTTHAIDDKFGNAYVVSLIRGVKSYLLDAPYNRVDHSIVGGRVRRVDSVTGFMSKVFKDLSKEVPA